MLKLKRIKVESFVEFYLENKENELKHKWKIIDFLIEEDKLLTKENSTSYYPISKLKEILKKTKKC